jgi:hypothetical protein
MKSFLGPVGLANSSITPPASSKTLTTRYYSTNPSKTTEKKKLGFLIETQGFCKYGVELYNYNIPSPHFEAVATKYFGSVNPCSSSTEDYKKTKHGQ